MNEGPFHDQQYHCHPQQGGYDPSSGGETGRCLVEEDGGQEQDHGPGGSHERRTQDQRVPEIVHRLQARFALRGYAISGSVSTLTSVGSPESKALRSAGSSSLASVTSSPRPPKLSIIRS